MKEQLDIPASQIFPANEASPLAILYDAFAESSVSCTPKIVALTKELRELLQQNAAKSVDDTLDRVSLLCVEYQREGFFAGVRIGIKLINDISR